MTIMYNCIQYIWLSTAWLEAASIALFLQSFDASGSDDSDATPMWRPCTETDTVSGKGGVWGNEMAIAVIQIMPNHISLVFTYFFSSYFLRCFFWGIHGWNLVPGQDVVSADYQ